jgi:opacity protein-like surface antigen
VRWLTLPEKTVPRTCLLLTLIATLAAPVVVNAAAAAEAAPPQFQVTPFIGYRVGGNFELVDSGESVKVADHASFALALDMRGADWSQYELFYGRQATNLTGSSFAPAAVKIEYLHLGGTVDLGEGPRLVPYLGGGLGVARLTPDSAGGDSDTRFSISLALGARLPLSPHFALRLEGRGFLTPINTDGAIFCHSDESGGVCAVRASGSLFFQFDVLAGATYTF